MQIAWETSPPTNEEEFLYSILALKSINSLRQCNLLISIPDILQAFKKTFYFLLLQKVGKFFS